MRKLLIVTFVSASALIALPVAAQDSGGGGGSADSGGAAAAGGGGAGAGSTTTYNFDDDLVSGDLVRPDGELLNVRRRGRRSSLIQVREAFIQEMLKSVEDL